VGRRFGRNNQGYKQTVQVRLDGVLLDRNFRNKGEAVTYLQREEDLTREEIKKRVRFVHNNPDVDSDNDDDWE
jgi:hypothetical protein